MSFEIDRHRYAELFGPTEGDSIRLGDTDLFIKIEKDYTGYGNECILELRLDLTPSDLRDALARTPP